MDNSEIIKKLIISNPLDYKYFYDVLIRLSILLVIGFILVIIFNLNNFKNITKSTVFKKLIGWAIMAPTFLISVICGGIPAFLLITFIVYKGLDEFFRIFYLPKFYFFALIFLWFVTVFVVIFSSFNYYKGIFEKLIYVLPVIYLLSLSLITILRGRIDDIMKKITYTFFASIWICYTMMHFILLSKKEFGKEMLLIIGFSVALSDVAAFCFGKIFEKIGFGIKYKIAENISPNKTYAGILGNIIGALIGVVLLPFNIPHLNIVHKITLIILIGIASSLGDMIESLIKRSAEIKDTADSIPGHGGFLDRIDSLLIVIVVVYYYLLFFTEMIK